MASDDITWMQQIFLFLVAVVCCVLSHEAPNPLQHQPLEHHHQPDQPQQQQFHQQPPVADGHQSTGRHQPHRAIDRESVHDAEHLKEHMHGQITEEEKLTDEEVQFRYFKVHDYDGNNKLDGIELIKALTHHHKGEGEEKRISDDTLSSMLNEILKENDHDDDGYIDYTEFIRSQRGDSA